ncbi:MAG TPA: hypothetical protein VMV22_05125 [Acidimicrobiales bacterium]|nr:hypothetical protein [Acidimicrobiales bacterium]
MLTDHQPVAGEVYARVPGLRRRAYDSGDHLEATTAFPDKRPPVFEGR